MHERKPEYGITTLRRDKPLQLFAGHTDRQWLNVFLGFAWVLMDRRVPATEWGNRSLILTAPVARALRRHCREQHQVLVEIHEGDTLGVAAELAVQAIAKRKEMPA